MRFWQLLLIVSALAAAYLLGCIVTLSAYRAPPPLPIPDERAFVSTVVLHSWNDGKLSGVLRGSGRLLVGTRIVVPDGSGAFTVALSLPRQAPSAGLSSPGFVASKRGKRYYPAGSPAAGKLSPKNLLFFATRAEAEAAGFSVPP